MSTQQPQHSEQPDWYANTSNPPSTNPAYNAEPEIVYGVVDEASPNNPNNQQNNTREKRHTGRQVGGAAVAGGIAGLVLIGPMVGVVAAGCAAVAATTKGVGGDVARSTGEAVSSAGDRLKKIDQKHHVVEKTSKGFVKGCNWVSKKIKPRDSNSSSRP